MPGWVSFNVAAFMPAVFACLATVLAARTVKRRWFLFMILAIFVFAGAQDIGMAPLQDFGSEHGLSASELIVRDTQNRLIADVVSALLGGLVMCRTAKAFGTRV